MICEACQESAGFADLGGLCQACSDDLVENTRSEMIMSVGTRYGMGIWEARPWRLDARPFFLGCIYGTLIAIVAEFLW